MVMLIIKIIIEAFKLLCEIAPYLLFGFIIAGVIYIILPKEKIMKHLGKENIRSIIKAAIFGIPLPLCSCGVLPTAASLRRQGASKSATLSFLISTPTSGVDSILATYSLLGILFAAARPIASFIIGIFSGILSILFDKKEEKLKEVTAECVICDDEEKGAHTHKISGKLKAMSNYAFVTLVEDIGKWLLIGILIGGIITVLLPQELINRYLGEEKLYQSMFVMLFVGIPIYVCATGAIPIAAALLLKGLAPAAALVFLITGPATNTVTMSVIYKTLGKRSLIIYLLSIIIGALTLSLIFDKIYILSGADIKLMQGSMEMLPYSIKIISTILFLLLIINAYFIMPLIKKMDNKNA